MIVKLLGHSRQGNMVKIEDTKNPKGYTWYFLAPNVLSIGKSLPDNSMVEMKAEEQDGQDTITYLTIAGKTNTGGSAMAICANCGATLKDSKFKLCYTCNMANKEKGVTATTSEFKCIDCGAPLKDNKFKTCYNCSMKRKENGESSSDKSPDVQASIVKQAMMKSASLAVATAMVGQVDIEALASQIETLYERMLAKIS
jgi:hypothetical protein